MYNRCLDILAVKNSYEDWNTIYSPYSKNEIGRVEQASSESLTKAVDIAYTTGISKMKLLCSGERAEILKKASDMVRNKLEYLAKMISLEGGKPIRDARIEVARAASTLDLCAEVALTVHGEEIPMGRSKLVDNRIAFTVREPIGVVLAISAFNHPVNLIAHQVGPALAMGNAVIVKPASTTPFSCYELVDILHTAGIPIESCIIAPCRGKSAEVLVSDKRVAFISFIGSSEQGWHIRRIASDGCRLSLEHGGTAPVVICSDSDFEKLIPSVLKGAYYHAGQVCISSQRIFVEKNSYDRFLSDFLPYVKKLKVGDPLLDDTDVGPIITGSEHKRIAGMVSLAKISGANIETGGSSYNDTCYEPTLLTQVKDDMAVMKEEIFGPVACVTPFDSLDEVINRVNSNNQPFQASVFTKDIDKAFYLSRKIKSNAVIINDHSAFRVDWMPFGGQGVSGLGLGGPKYAADEMSVSKMICINIDSK